MSTPATEPERTADRPTETIETDASAGWREEYGLLDCTTEIEPEHAEAMHRQDRPERYRRKHRRGVSS
jgi:hypothetical protein